MKKIPLTKGQFAIVDDWWYDYLMQWKWCVAWSKSTKSYYATRLYGYPKRKHVYMARVVAKTPEGMECDHIYHNTLDNRESKLRNVTRSQNQINKKAKRITKRSDGYGYRIRLNLNHKTVFDKTCATLSEATTELDRAEKVFFGDFRYQR